MIPVKKTHPSFVNYTKPLGQQVCRGYRDAKPIPTLDSGLSALDNLLPYGGIPQGRLSEISGGRSSGKRSLALSFCIQTLRRNQRAAWIDAGSNFYPLPALELGLPLEQLLVIRHATPNQQNVLKTADMLLQPSGALDLLVIDLSTRFDRSTQRQKPSSSQLSRLRLASERSATAVLFITELPDHPQRSTVTHSLGTFICLHLIVSRPSCTRINVTIAKSKLGKMAHHIGIPVDAAHSMCLDTSV